MSYGHATSLQSKQQSKILSLEKKKWCHSHFHFMNMKTELELRNFSLN